MLWKLKSYNCVVAFLSSAFQAFGMYNIHALSDITEGGVLGATLLLEHWFAISPAVSGFVMNAACYLLEWRTLGKQFIACSLIAAAGFSLALKSLYERDVLSVLPITALLLNGFFVIFYLCMYVIGF